MSRMIYFLLLTSTILLAGCNGTSDPNHGNIRYSGSSQINKDPQDDSQESNVKLQATYPR